MYDHGHDDNEDRKIRGEIVNVGGASKKSLFYTFLLM